MVCCGDGLRPVELARGADGQGRGRAAGAAAGAAWRLAVSAPVFPALAARHHRRAGMQRPDAHGADSGAAADALSGKSGRYSSGGRERVPFLFFFCFFGL